MRGARPDEMVLGYGTGGVGMYSTSSQRIFLFEILSTCLGFATLQRA